MAFPATAQDVAVEMHLGGAWVDVTGDVRQDRGIDISRGQSSEGAQAQPSTCSLVLDNRTGKYSPRNPTGAYFSSIGRNTPLRVSLGDTAEDAFGRTVSNGWGSADLGGAWTTSGGVAGDYAVGSGVGTHAVTAAATSRLTYLNGLSLGDVDVAVTVTLPVTNITGAPAEPANIAVRGVGSDYVMVRLQIETDESVKIGILTAAGAVLATPATVTGLTHSSAQALRVRVVAEGQTVKARVWAATASEPATWHTTATGTTAQVLAAGYVGVRSGLATGNTNATLTFSYDTFEVRRPRFHGEVSEWPVRSDISGNDITVSIEASGILRRLSQGQAPLKSPMRRNVSSGSPKAYWALEDGRDSTEFGSVAGGPAMRDTGDITPASNTDFACSDALPEFGPAIGPAIGTVPAYTDTGYVYAAVLAKLDTTGFAENHPLMTLNMSGSGVMLWSLQSNVNGRLRLQALDSSRTVVSDSLNVNFGVTHQRLLMLIINFTQVGADIDWSITTWEVGGDSNGLGFGGTLAGYTLGTVQTVTLGSNISLNGTIMGHPHVSTTPYTGTLVVPVLDAHVGETAGARIKRLCDEEDIGVVLVGNTADTELLGPQGLDTLLDLIGGAADSDQGILAEPRGTLGVLYRTRASLYNQAATLTLNYATNQLQPPFAPTDDDRHVRNEVTVQRDGGAEYRHVEESGPLSVTAVGRYDEAVTVSLYRDTQVQDQAAWRVHLGTVDEPRFPSIAINVAKNTALRASALAVDLGSRLVITNPPSWLPPDDISVLVQGYTEHLSRFEHSFVFNGVPESPYRVIKLDDSTYRLDSDATTLSAALTTTATSVAVAISDDTLWTTDAAEYPFDLVVGGEKVTATAIASSVNDTFTRTVSSGWGTADTGQAWTTSGGAASDYATTGTLGTLSLGSVNVSRRVVMTAPHADVDFSAEMGTSALATGDNQFAAIMARYSDSSNYYYARLTFATSGAITLSIVARVAGTATTLGSYSTGLTHVAGTRYRVRFQLRGTKLRARAWAIGATEPTVWHVEVTDTALTAAGSIGCYALLGSANTNALPVTASFDGFEVRNPQTFTVTRSVNSVVKTHAAGAEVRLAQTPFLAL